MAQYNQIPISKANLVKFGVLGGLGLVGILFLNAFTVISVGQRGVVMNFGKVENTILNEGLHFKWPLITRIKAIDVRVRKTDIEVPAGTKDLQIITTAVTLNWHIDPQQVNRVYQQIGDEKTVNTTVVIPVLTEVLKAATPRRNTEEILQKRDMLKTEIDQEIVRRLKNYGLIIDDVSLTNVQFSPEFAKSIEEKQIAEQDAKRAAYLAQKAANEAQAEINAAKGKAEAQRLLKASLTPEIIQQQAIAKWNGQLPTMMLGDQPLPFVSLPAK